MIVLSFHRTVKVNTAFFASLKLRIHRTSGAALFNYPKPVYPRVAIAPFKVKLRGEILSNHYQHKI